MSRVQRFLRWWSATAAAVAGGLGFLLRDWLTTNGVGLNIGAVLLAALVFVAIRTGEAIAAMLVDHSQWIRRRIFRQAFVEGSWFEGCLDAGEKQIRSVSLITIGYSDHNLFISGEVFSCDGRSEGTFRSYLTSYECLTLWYLYQRRSARETVPSATGRGELNFTASARRPISYRGTFFDQATATEIRVDGRLITDAKTLAKLADHVGRQQVVIEAVRFFSANYEDFAVLPNPFALEPISLPATSSPHSTQIAN